MRAKIFILSGLFLLTEQTLAFNLPNPLAIKAYECPKCRSSSQETMTISWPLSSLNLDHDTLHQQSSRKYQIKVSLKQLQQGVSIHTLAPKALIRISPVNPQSTLKPTFQIKSTNSLKLSLMDASSLFAKEEGLKETAFTENTLAIAKLKPELGSGEFILSSPDKTLTKAEAEDSYFIQVFDANSTTELSIRTDKARYQWGDNLKAIFSLHDKNTNHLIETIDVFLTNPEGEKIPLKPEPNEDGSYEVSYPLVSEKNDNGENWYITSSVSGMVGKRKVERQSHSAFSYTIPSAALRSLKKNPEKAFGFTAEIEVATASRYALQAVLFGTDAQGKLHPIQTAQTASWLTEGLNNFNFSFDSNLKSDYKEPYYLGYLRLTDYGQHKPVYIYDEPIALSNLG
ncbi:MAG: DUF4785 family protein [Tatlockia sp.]|nr:DUF4785 family protein [Tatlockia sp.]